MSLIVPGAADRAAVALYPTLQHLLDLRDGGWRFLPIEPGRDQLDGFRLWPGGWRDAIRLKSDSDALGLRLDPDNMITWELSGTLAEVVHELVLLPHPGDRLAPRLARGHGPN
ncbi:hypothetical protein [Lentzea sp. NPDC060358]|uniref:hypothetical protein n=1 Tax=Lentzea sp. NPDC060358 TaxID=3347103 RepID=UPI00364A1B67